MRTLFLVIRVPLVIAIILAITFAGYGLYYKYRSLVTIEEASRFDDGAFHLPQEQGAEANASDVVITEFFDFRDSESYRLHQLFRQALDGDSHIVYRIRPVGLRDSEARDISLFLLAARAQDGGKAHDLVQQLITAGEIPTIDSVMHSAQVAGFDSATLKRKMTLIDNRKTEFRNFKMMKDIGFKVTPALTVGSRGYLYNPQHSPGVNFIKLMILEERKVLHDD